ncbi:hypothetical protein [Falsiroseomonas oryziterrae]|uniref:hypothetical protein n=1 Tax=Falsiroseomonas oryziterrae TaxID=2911368 RepID=UPI001F1754EC|nr:hypothetical protein [Roseomonas sp. NPKOSM-4]
MSQTVQAAGTGVAAVISGNVPLPGAVTGRRIVRLDLGLATTAFTTLARSAGQPWGADVGVSSERGRLTIDNERLSAMVAAATPASASLSKAKFASAAALGVSARVRPQIAATAGSAVAPNVAAASMAGAVADQIRATGLLQVMRRNWAGLDVAVPIDPAEASRPELMIIEVFGVSSFMGNYGVGRTVRTFTLLPGEETKISLKTWRSSETTVKEASSIVDSQTESASERFGEKVQDETSTKSTQSKKEHWYVEAEASASWGFGSASVKGGGGGEYQSGREEFAKRASEATSEHAREASSKRDTSVTSSSEQSVKTGEESLTERVIRNVNMRRTLNFVFRELNQEYRTYLHLKDIRIAFTNGRQGSYDEAPLSGLRQFLDKYVAPAQVEATARAILRVVATVFDDQDNPVRTIERVTMTPDGTGWTKAAAAPVSGNFPVPPSDGSWFYRFRRGPLEQNGAMHPVAGVVMKASTIVMRTDSVVIEALLGQSDALDAYAMVAQEAASKAKVLANDREALGQKILADITDPEKRAAAFAAMFNAPAKP